MSLFSRKKTFGEFIKGVVKEGDFTTTKPGIISKVVDTAKDVGKTAGEGAAISATAIGGAAAAAKAAEMISRERAKATFKHGKGKTWDDQ